MKKTILTALAAAATLAGCADYPDNIEAAYIPSIVYKGATCYELTQERKRLADYVNQTAYNQRRSANWDTALVSTSAFIFWPALAGLPLTRDQTAQLAVARGHYDALIKAGRNQNCGMEYLEPVQTRTINRGPTSFPPL